MKRRDFLKKLGVACGAAAACPATLLKDTSKYIIGVDLAKKEQSRTAVKYLWMRGKDDTYIEGQIYDEFATPRDLKIEWIKLYPRQT